MKLYVLSDNVDTQLGFRLAGIEGEVLHEKAQLLKALEATQSMDVGIVLITSKLIALAPKEIANRKLYQNKPLLVEIPDRHASIQLGELIDHYVFEALGISL